MIRVDGLTKSYGAQLLFDRVSFAMAARERVGLVGRNGHGKTTLLKMLTGEEHPDSGSVSIPRHYRLGFVSQRLTFTKNTAIEEACAGLPAERADERYQAEKVLAGLGFARGDLSRHPNEFSGGFQVRLNLARTLVSEPNLLLLDEPTNYLDITSIRWLSGFLRAWRGELILVTHDRSFMDCVTTHTMGIHRARLRKIRGGTDKYYAQIMKEEEIHEKTRQNDERKRKEVELFISRFRAKARLASLVQSRIKSLEKREKLDRLERIKVLDFSFNEAPFPGKRLLHAEGIRFSYSGEAPFLLEDFSLSVARHDRICVIGKNGKGKTTLLRLLAGELSPLAGSVELHPRARTGYYVQTNVSMLRKNFTVEEEIASSLEGGEKKNARDICGAMLFEGDEALKRIAVLSGGEMSRVLIGKILAAPANLLLLDEPTNHLDMESADALLAALDNFDGAVVIVTHNELFLNALATRLVVFQRGGVKVHEGSYQSFLEKTGWEDEADKAGISPPGRVAGKKELRRLRSEIVARRSKTLRPLEELIEDVERRIRNVDAKLSQENALMIEASSRGDGSKIPAIAKAIHESKTELDGLYEELERLSSRHEEESARFDEELSSLDGMRE